MSNDAIAANNATSGSQIAEGVARSMVPAETKVWSAGSRPTSVRPEAIAVLKEVGVDISHHRSKAVTEIPAAEATPCCCGPSPSDESAPEKQPGKRSCC